MCNTDHLAVTADTGTPDLRRLLPLAKRTGRSAQPCLLSCGKIRSGCHPAPKASPVHGHSPPSACVITVSGQPSATVQRHFSWPVY